MVKLIYVGRLDKEKGIEELIFAVTQLGKTQQNISITIYGDGAYKSQIQELANNYPTIVTYHGRKKKTEILTEWKSSDYFVMPSQFLETFGLTACESLLCEVPVIGNKKGGLIPFIDNKLDIQQYQGTHDGDKLFNLLSHLINHNITKDQFSDLIHQTQHTYTVSTRHHQITSFLSDNKKILFVSDYINYNGGGIETHIHDAKEVLESYNATVELYGHQAPKPPLQKIKKLRTMARSRCNIKDTLRLHYLNKQHNNTTIWRHSISRVIGWLPVYCGNKHAQHLITHHELGLFHPYPSKVYSRDQIPDARSWKQWYKAGKTNNPLLSIFIIGKYLLVRLIHKSLQRNNTIHIVPSDRMIQVVQARHPHATIIYLPHFVKIGEEK